MTCLDTLIVFNLAVQCFICFLEEQKFPVLQILISIFMVVLLQRRVVREVFIKIRFQKKE